jgi:hypothetical protein
MKKIILCFSLLALFAVQACKNDEKQEAATNIYHHSDTNASAASEPAAEQQPPMDSAAQTKAWEAYMTPGPMHKWLASTDGKWEAEFTFWHSADAPPQKGAKAKAQFKTILDGRYQESVYKGDMFGMPFEGRGMTAYDNAKKKFITTWIDNMGTGMMYMEGTYDENSRTLTCTGKSVDPITGRETEMREVLRVIDDEHQVLEMYDKKGGPEYKSMEIKLTKK